jgi:hypothetical protein
MSAHAEQALPGEQRIFHRFADLTNVLLEARTSRGFISIFASRGRGLSGGLTDTRSLHLSWFYLS